MKVRTFGRILCVAAATAATMSFAAPALALSPAPPPANAGFDYQIGGDYPLPPGVSVVSRDWFSGRPAADPAYSICYVNAFQTQASEKRFWRSRPGRWALVLKKDGRPVTDSGWGEWLLDTRTAGRRDRLARIVGRWIAGCATDGFDAVELDNLDSWSRSSGLIGRADNRRLARLLVARAHRHGLAVAQKNWVELGAAGPRIGFDFAVVEQCGQFHECGAYARTYGDRVLAVEYSRRSFRWTCDHVGDRISVVRRDLDLTRGGVRRWC